MALSMKIASSEVMMMLTSSGSEAFAHRRRDARRRNLDVRLRLALMPGDGLRSCGDIIAGPNTTSAM
jgi:hypothetical protein